MSTARELRAERFQAIAVDRAALLRPNWPQLGIRAVFGGGIALGAGLVGMRFGPLAGGLFLAFPAVLPAALTLLEKKDGDAVTDVDAVGAISGALGMVAFAVVLFALGGGHPHLGLVAASATWIVVALSLFIALRLLLRRLPPGSGGGSSGYDRSGSRRTGGRRAA